MLENNKFYDAFLKTYNGIEKKEVSCKFINVLKNKLPFPYMPFNDDVIDENLKKTIYDIVYNKELVFIGSKSFDTENSFDGNINKVGAVCKIDLVENNDRVLKYFCQPLYLAEITKTEILNNGLLVTATPLIYSGETNEDIKFSIEMLLNKFNEYLNFVNKKLSVEVVNFIENNALSFPNVVVNIIVSVLDASLIEQYNLQKETNIEQRIEQVIVLLNKLISIELLNKKIDAKINNEYSKKQKELYIKEKIKYLTDEIEDTDEIAILENKIKTLNLSKTVEEFLLNQVKKLSKTPVIAPDYNVLKNHLDTVLELPWNKSTVDNVNINHAKEILDNEHYGLEKVKQRILEYIAVLQLNKKVSGQILCLVGAPGVGKTSIAKSVAHALNRKFVKMTLGGVYDESEIRGHRKTFVGAMCGKIMHNIKLADSSNPVFLLDEIDKITSNIHGDPASALLEVLDPAQNDSFVDNFLEIPFDLSRVIFIATANNAEKIPPALYDRMEIINVDSYMPYEKVEIAKHYLLKRELKNNGLPENALLLDDSVVMNLINNYTYEAGVRNLERLIAKICRSVAVKLVENDKLLLPYIITNDMIPQILQEAPITKRGVNPNSLIGVGYGLGWTPYGGTILTLEGSVIKGKGDIIITGNLKDVMKESCKIALTVAKREIENYGKQLYDYNKIDIHINACNGSVQKDGPSAGGVLTLVIYSTLTNQKIRNDFALTGEISLSGQITAIGGLREKLYACVENNITNVIVPKENKKDVEFISNKITNKLKIHYVENIKEIIDLAIVKE